MTGRRVKRAIIAIALGVTVGGCATLLGIEDIPGGGVADGGSDAASDSTTTDAVSDATPDAGSDGSTGSDAAESGCPFVDSGTVVAQSCVLGGAGRTNCGGSGAESCCTSLPVPCGTYDRTYTNNGSGATGKADPATVAGFRLDKYEVTVGRFRQFVNAWNNGAGWKPPAGSGKHTHLNGGQGLENSASPGTYEAGWATLDDGNIAPTNAHLASCSTFGTWTNTATNQENLPINCVTWYESAAFCIWDGGFLPSEAEWEYAAAGGSQERQYPWGSTPPGTANQYAIYGDGANLCYYPSPASCSGVSNIAPVGTLPSGAGLWGQLDLAGNAWEWNLDGDAAYTPCANCADLAVSDRVVRGGNFYGGPSLMLPPYRASRPATLRFNSVGFRCARTP